LPTSGVDLNRSTIPDCIVCNESASISGVVNRNKTQNARPLAPMLSGLHIPGFEIGYRDECVLAAMIRPFLIAALCGLTLPAFGDTAKWKQVGSWDVSFYTSVGGCQAFAYVNDATAFFIGYDTTTGNPALDVTVTNPGWQEIRKDESYSVSLRFGDKPAWTLDMRGVNIDNRPGLHIVFPADTDVAEEFVQEFRRERHMDWSYGDTELGRFSLKGSGKAFDAVRSCQKKKGVH
jgi:hypothetical protein